MLRRNSYKDFTIAFLWIGVVIALLLRILFLDKIPRGFSCDEASFGYEAYSILTTLRDRYGRILPPFLQLFGNDYPSAIYVFPTALIVKLFGINEFATRFLAAIIGTLTIVVLYYLVKELFDKRIALIAALLLAISPWHIHYSRIAFNLVFLPFLTCMGLLFFVKSFKQPKYLPLSGLFFGFSLYTYSAARVFIPLFVLSLAIIFWKHLWRNKIYTLMALGLFLLIFVPLFRFWISSQGMARMKGSGLLSNPVSIIQSYLSYFSPKFLFWQGNADANENPAGIGALHGFELVTTLVGFVTLIRKRRKETAILLIWLFLYPIPSALVGPESVQRSIVGAPVFAIISAYGVSQLLELFRARRLRIFNITALIFLVASLTIFGNRYFINPSVEAAKRWQYGIGEAIAYAQKSSYNCIVINSDSNSGCFAIYDFVGHIPFYTQYPPQKYQKAPLPPWVRGSRDKVYSLGKYHLMSLSKQSKLDERCLFILRPEKVSELAAKGYNWKEVYVVKDNRGIEHFKLIEVSKVKI